MVHVKGSTLIPRVRYMELNATEEQQEQILEGLGEDLRGALQQGILAASWYPFEFFVELIRSLDLVLGRGDLALARVLGRDAANQLLKTVYPAFFRQGNPNYLFQKAAAVWNQFYDSGRLSVSPNEDDGIRLTVSDFDSPAREHCLSVVGWIETNIEFSGGVEVEVREVSCRVEGDPACVFLARWKESDEG